MEATYESKCAVCGDAIHEGDEIGFDEDAQDWVHVAHLDEEER